MDVETNSGSVDFAASVIRNAVLSFGDDKARITTEIKCFN